MALAEWQRRPGPWCRRRSPDAPPCFSPFKIRRTNRTRLLLTQRICRSTEWVSCSCLCRLPCSATKTVIIFALHYKIACFRQGRERGGCMLRTQILAPSNPARAAYCTAEAQLHACRESPSFVASLFSAFQPATSMCRHGSSRQDTNLAPRISLVPSPRDTCGLTIPPNSPLAG